MSIFFSLNIVFRHNTKYRLVYQVLANILHVLLLTFGLLTPQCAGAGQLCSKFFLTKSDFVKTKDQELDYKIMGGLTYITDSMGTIQRINPHKIAWAIADETLSLPTSLQDQIQTDVSGVPDTGITQIHVNLKESKRQIALELGSKTQFQRDPNYISMKLNRDLPINFSHGLSFHVTSKAPIEIKIVIGASRRQQSGSQVEHFNKQELFESTFQTIPTDANQIRTIFYWSDFKSSKLALTDDIMADKIWLVIKSPQGLIKKVDLKFDGPIYTEQVLIDGNPKANPDKFWKGIGVPINNHPKFLFQNPPRDFRIKIFNNLFEKQNQLQAIQAQKNNTLQSELKNLGFDYEVFDKKIEQESFFNFFHFIVEAKIPIETGEFGEYHGAETHALQIYAITRGMSNSEIILFRNIYKEIGHNSFFGWKIWTALFDNPQPDVPTGPRFWSRLLQQAQQTQPWQNF